MKTFLLLSLFFFSSLGFASTRAHFLGFQGMIQLFAQDSNGGSDPDSSILLNAMNVPSQNSPLGPGKAIKTADKVLNLICAQGQKGPQCTILLQASSHVKLNPSAQIIEYEIHGADAQNLARLFHLDADGEFHLISSDGYFRLDVEAQRFHILYNGAGL